MNFNTVLIIVLGLLFGSGMLYGIYRFIRLFGIGVGRIKEIADKIEAGDMEAQQTPKSLSSVDSLVLPRILRDFPEFDIQLMRRRAEQDTSRYLTSLKSRRSQFTEKDGIRSFLERMQEMVNWTKTVPAWERPKVHRAALSNYENRSNYCYVTYQVAYQYELNGRTWQKKLEIRYLAADEPDMEKKISVYNCPNCGAPVGSIGQKKCQYCGTLLNPSAVLSWYIFEINEIA